MKALLCVLLAIAVLPRTHATAQQPALQAPAPAVALIPMPREIKRVAPPVALRAPVIVVAGRDSADRDAAAIFIAELAERHVAARTVEGRGWRVELLRTGSAGANRALADAGVTFDPPMHDEGYVLIAGGDGARVVGATAAGVFYGLQTLVQLIGVSPSGATIRPVAIRDWPAMRWRGVHDDLSRGPVPTLEYQKRQVRTAAAFKINVWSPYFEQSLEYLSQPLAAPPGGVMSQADVRELVRYAAHYHVTIVPEQEAFGHLHHLLKYDIYTGLAETPHGHVLAPGDTGSLALIKDMFTEIAQVFPSPFIHLGADETFELGRGRTKALVDSVKLGPVYIGFLGDIVRTLQPLMKDRRFMFWGDVAGGSPDLVPRLPKDMIAVAWGYGGTERPNLRPFRNAGMETWVAPGVSSWNRVWPNFGTALSNIRNFARDGQAGGSTGLLNTVWDDDGDAIFEETWYGLLFGAAAAWQSGESNIERFQDAFGEVFHGDTTGAINAAQRALIAAHAALQRTRAGDGNTSLFFLDPWAPGEDTTVKRLRPALAEARIRAESALVLVAKARRQSHLREQTALDAMELGARRIDWLAAKFEYSDMIASAFANASADSVHARQFLQDLTGMNGVFQDMRDGYSLTRDLFERAWRNENRPYWMTNALARFDVELQRWVERTIKFDQAMRRWSREGIRPSPADIGLPVRLLPPPKM